MGSCSDDVNTIVEDFKARILESNLINRCKKVLIAEYIKRIVEVVEAEEYL